MVEQRKGRVMAGLLESFQHVPLHNLSGGLPSKPAVRRVGFPSAFLSHSVPRLRAVHDHIPSLWSGRGRWRSGPMHTFVDDYRQEFFWRRPFEGLAVALSAGWVTAPDFSVYPDDPDSWRDYQVWRSFVVADFFSSHGINVLPVVSFGTNCAQYVEAGGTWAVRGPRLNSQGFFAQQIRIWAREASPARLVVFGNPAPGLPSWIEVIPRRLESHHGRS